MVSDMKYTIQIPLNELDFKFAVGRPPKDKSEFDRFCSYMKLLCLHK